MKELWRQHAFRWYWLGMFLSGLGDQFGWMGLTWFVMKKTGSPAAMGGVVLAYMLPAVFAGLVAGVLLDRFDRRKLIMVDNVARGLIFIALVALLLVDHVPLFVIYVLIVIAGTLSPLSTAGAQTLLPRLLADKRHLVKANGVMESQWQIIYMFGPALAGVLIGLIGEAYVLLIDAASFFVCALCFSRLPKEMTKSANPESAAQPAQIGLFLRSLFADMKTGYRYLFGKKQIVALVLFTFLFNMSYGPIEVALPLYANQNLAGGSVALGMLWSSLAIGALLGSLFFSTISWRIPLGVTLAGIIVLWGITTMPLAFFSRLEVAMIAMALAGFSYSPYNIMYRSYLQRQVPDALLGRVMTSIRTITGTGMPAGAAVSGVLIPTLGVQGLFGAGAAVCIACGLLAFGVLRDLESPSLAVEERGD
ncbi:MULTISPECIES: MFS transporter [Brevibacillus]|uniref:MFS transporter n=1 Tax=Brevibacillus TaxID=55080 RepID=UPI000271CC5E|nr:MULTISPECIES: MFS transporter [Brevibacillus]EJL43286.1 arabinose efflux permease family protein [Brevibacillus sp. CF112]MED1824450.1 MFS transporter [Brevibacillus agri]